MRKLRYLAILISLAAVIFLIAPASARWSASWGSGSTVGFGTVDGLKKAKQNGASLQSVVAHPGATFCSKMEDHDKDKKDKDKDKDSCDEPDDNHSFAAPLNSVNPPNPGTTPGVVFCQALNYYNKVVQAKNLVNVPQNFNGSAFIPPNQIDGSGNASFSISNSIDQATLNS